jgi:hypothetical protein
MREVFYTSLLIMAFLTALLAIELTPSEAGPVTIITDPFSRLSAIEVIATAQGEILSAGRWPWIAVAIHSEDPDFQKKLKASGAWLLLPPLTATCLKDVTLQKFSTARE